MKCNHYKLAHSCFPVAFLSIFVSYNVWPNYINLTPGKDYIHIWHISLEIRILAVILNNFPASPNTQYYIMSGIFGMYVTWKSSKSWSNSPRLQPTGLCVLRNLWGTTAVWGQTVMWSVGTVSLCRHQHKWWGWTQATCDSNLNPHPQHTWQGGLFIQHTQFKHSSWALHSQRPHSWLSTLRRDNNRPESKPPPHVKT